MKHTKKALVSASLALLLCFAMLVGTTFAWFTDSVTSAGNIIKSGKLDLTVDWADGTAAVPGDDSTDWKDASANPIFNYTLWEPGYTEVRHVRIHNAGTLALKYQVQIAPTGTVSDLADVIDVYYFDPAQQVANRTDLTGETPMGTLTQALAGMSTTASGNLQAGDSHTITLALHMKESAGNEYQDKQIGSSFAIKVLATQLTSETDGFDDQYDAAAEYINPAPVENNTQLSGSLTDGTADDVSVVLTDDIDLPISSLGTITPGSGQYKLGGDDTDSITIDLAGKTLNIETTYWSVLGAKNPNCVITIKNGTINSTQTSGTWNSYDVGFKDCKFVLENVTFEKSVYLDTDVTMKNVTINESHDYYAVWICTGAKTIEMENVTINCPNGRAIKIDDQYRDAGLGEVKLSVKDSAFTSLKKAAILVKSKDPTTISIDNLDISNVAADSTNEVWRDNASGYETSVINVTGGTLINEP